MAITMEELRRKAKAYDEVREKIALRFGSNVAEEIFSEYEMSEGEKIKKDVKRAISVALDYSYFDKETANNCLAWLEKQVPVDEEKVLIGARTDVALSIMDFLDRNTHGMCLSNMECKDLEDAVVD